MNLIWISGALKFGFFGCDSCTAVFVGKQSQTYITYIYIYYISIYNINTMFIDIISVFIRVYILHKYYIYIFFLSIFLTNIHRFEAGYVNQWTFSSLDNFTRTWRSCSLDGRNVWCASLTPRRLRWKSREALGSRGKGWENQWTRMGVPLTVYLWYLYVFIVFCRDSWGWKNPVNSHYIGLI